MDAVSIITVNFNQPEVTLELLSSLKKNYQDEIEVIVVDNASEVNSEAAFKKIIPGLLFIRSEINLGFAGGNNLGIKSASGDYIFLLNNDTEIPVGCLETMIDEFKANPHIGLLSPLILYHHDKNMIQYAGYTPMNYVMCRNSQIGQYEKNRGQYNDLSYETGFCHGAAVMCRRSDLFKAGLMEENYFLYYEELDWCEKFRRMGKTINFTGKTFIYHKESISVGKESAIKTFFLTRNRMLFIRRNTSLRNTLLFSFYFTFIACPKTIFVHLRNKRGDLAKWVLKALIWNYTHQVNSGSLGFNIKR